MLCFVRFFSKRWSNVDEASARAQPSGFHASRAGLEGKMSVDTQQLSAVLERLAPEESQMMFQFADFLAQRRERIIDARKARRKVSAWLVQNVGNLLMGGEPRYVAGERPVWRVPVVVSYGRRGVAAFVDVDAQSGALLVNEQTPQEIIASVQASVSGATPGWGKDLEK